MREIPDINYRCPVCGEETLELYMVTAECWAEAGFTFYQNVHLRCLVESMDRPLTNEDFTDVPVNFIFGAMFEKAGLEPPPGFGSPLEREERWCENNA